ncbi:roadblock/LC7 domain-containing protein [Streptomyces botrytidirepellens]|uniref:Roadblock/LC7 domain-containing protein n=1 Tax=Streptomyces botrytidirepellens TaxID=2486417 RepID=A0A3M8X6T6_9ACTN|nr:roadblock/LC7 domain-containing protein [Streptomyces botrytidirepellens]RNG37364.1 roadblock/LC7 domain-containing protein [Streptomyces botrytidirepellens]
MQTDGSPATGQSAARDKLSALLTKLLNTVPGTNRALLAAGDGLKLAWTEQPDADADAFAAAVVGLYSLGRQVFKDNPLGGIRQIIVEHDGGHLFVMSAGVDFTHANAVNTVLAVKAAPDADAGQVGYEMDAFIRGLDEHLVVEARPNAFSGPGL